MPFGFWVLGNLCPVQSTASLHRLGLKCLSAFGFWGTTRIESRINEAQRRVSNAFRLLGSGELLAGQYESALPQAVSNAFRLLGSGERIPSSGGTNTAHPASQMPFGFWVLGNILFLCEVGRVHGVSNAFRLLGSGEQLK